MKNWLTLLLAFFAITVAQAQSKWSPLGVWLNESGEARIEIYTCQKDKLCGKIVWLKDPLRDGKPKTDINNPDSKKTQRPILNLVMMEGFEHDEGNKWDDGTIYDPKNGKTYSCNLTMLSADKLEVRGYIGFSMIGRSQAWTRVK